MKGPKCSEISFTNIPTTAKNFKKKRYHRTFCFDLNVAEWLQTLGKIRVGEDTLKKYLR